MNSEKMENGFQLRLAPTLMLHAEFDIQLYFDTNFRIFILRRRQK